MKYRSPYQTKVMIRTPFLFVPSKGMVIEDRKKILFAFLILLLVFGGIGLWLFFGNRMSNPKNYGHIGEIPPPSGYERIAGTNPGYTQFLRSLLLKPKGSKVKLYTGGNAHFQTMNYAVVDLPMLSNAEQCADACMRLKAEYLYQTGQYKRLNFKTSTASPCATAVGHREKPFTAISADSMALPAPSHSAARCSPVHWQISTRDVFVYPGNGKFLGHAVIVVAVNKNGKKPFSSPKAIHRLATFTSSAT